MLSRRERLTKSEAFLKSLAPSEAADYAPQEFWGVAGAAAAQAVRPSAGAAAGPGLAPRKAVHATRFGRFGRATRDGLSRARLAQTDGRKSMK